MTARELRKRQVRRLLLVVTHGTCSPGWKANFFPFGEEQPFDQIWLGNTRPRGLKETKYESSTGGRIREVDLAPAIAETLIKVLEEIL